MKLDVIPELLRRFPLNDDCPWWLAVDLGLIRRRFQTLRATFPDWLHAVAVKAHPLRGTLDTLVEAGSGLEAASFGELEISLDVGCPPERVVFDSPAKTRTELRRALDLGVAINADNFSELDRIDDLLGGESPSSFVGLRINPEVEPSSIGALSTGSPNSKFGVSLGAERDRILAAFDRYDWLTGLHVHIGSKAYGPADLAAGLVPIVELAERVGASHLDIGGGLPPAVTPGAYRDALERTVPVLFDGSLNVVTEFGRWLFAHAGVAVSTVEYVKAAADCNIATIHFGADFMLRNAYQPGVWSHPIRVLTADGTRKFDDERPVTIAGPLCFGGDVLVREADLPAIEEGDVVAVRDVGAYTFGMWSEFCSRPRPRFVLVGDGEPRMVT